MYHTPHFKKPERASIWRRRTSLGVAVLFALSSAMLSNFSIATEADNTRSNQYDESKLTPIDQSNDPADIKIAAAIRSAITGDSALSTNAQNIKIIVRQAVVTLRGPVENAAEKSRVDQLAKSAQGVARVDNQLSVKNNY